MSNSPTKCVIAFLAIGLLVGASTTAMIPPVLAAGATQITRFNVVFAGAFIPRPMGQFSNIFLHVDKSSAGTDIVFGYDTPTILGANAFLTTAANVFQTNGFASATLSPVTLNACVATDASGNCIFVPVTIQATWTGLGGAPISSGVEGRAPTCNLFAPSNLHRLPSCSIVFQVGGTDRQATATGTLNGQSFGQATAFIATTKFLFISLPPSIHGQ